MIKWAQLDRRQPRQQPAEDAARPQSPRTPRHQSPRPPETPVDEHDERNFDVPESDDARPSKKARRAKGTENGARSSDWQTDAATNARNKANLKRLRAQMRLKQNASFDEPEAKRKRSAEDDPGDNDDTASVLLVMALVKSGVDYDLAKTKIKQMLNPTGGTFLELYGRVGITDEANGARGDPNIRGLGALDLCPRRANGSVWDFRRRADRRKALDMVVKLKPNFVIGSPPCAACSARSQRMNYPTMRKEDAERLMAEGRLHLDLMRNIYTK